MEFLAEIERCLLPPPEIIRWDQGKLTIIQCTTTEKITHCAKNAFSFIKLICTYLFTRVQSPQLQVKKQDLSAEVIWPPAQRGFATSLFQTSGLGTKWAQAPALEGKCDWDQWMDQPNHILHEEGFDYRDFFVDILSDPTNYIQMLKEQNVTSHRFSLEWSVIEPKPGEIDPKAVALYQTFITKLIEADITPSVTLNHFVLPDWFYVSGGFQKIENIDHYVQYALKAMDLFPEVKDWWSFNELGVKAFQQCREVYPTDVPEGSFLSTRVHAAGIATRNMLIAHCKLHKEVLELHPDKKVGVTHQWLKFSTATGNFLERLFAHIFTHFSFIPVYQFFKDGHYAFQYPFMANIHFEIPAEEFEANGHYLMRLGVQAYPQAYVKMGLNHGQTYPGLSTTIKNFPYFSFGATCEPGGTLMRFGPRCAPEEIDNILDEAFALTDQVFITEYGSDAMIQKFGDLAFHRDDEAQLTYLKDLTERVKNYCLTKGKQLQGIFCWSDLNLQMEWENGHTCKLALIDAKVDENRSLTGWIPTLAAEYMAKVYGLRDVDPCN